MEDVLFIHILKYLNSLYENGCFSPGDLDRLAVMALDFGTVNKNLQLIDNCHNNGYSIPENNESYEIHDNGREEYNGKTT